MTGTAISWVTGLASPGVVITNNGTISATSRGIDTSGSAISGNLTLINNAGAVFTSANDAFRINGGLASGSVTVDNAGTIQATGSGRVFDFVNATSNSTVFSITNRSGGTIKSSGSDVMRIGGGTTTITNSGLIDATTTAGSRAIRATTNLNNVIALSIVNNAGATIQSADDAIQINGSGSTNTTTAGKFSVDNAGTIKSATGQAIDFDNLTSTAASVHITNRATGLITTANADAIRPGENFTIDNYGQIIANGTIDPVTGRPSADAIDLQGGHNGTVNNYAGGLISGAKNGTAGDAGTITVNNYAGATIIGRNGAGVGGGNAIVTNYGTITGAIDGVSTRSDGIDVDFVLTLTNYGVVQGTGATGADDGGRFNNSEGLAIGGGTIRNYGTISGAAAGIVVSNDSNPDNSRSGSAALDLVNYAGATIVGNNSYAIRSENKTGTAADNDRIVNYGTIIGNGTIPDPNGVTLLQNGTPDPGSVGTLNGVTYTGTGATRFIRGDGAAIQTGEGADVLSNYGTIIGNSGRAVSMEGGDDTLNLYGGSSITGRIDGGVGTDTINLFGPGTGTLSNVINFEALNVQGGVWTVTDAQSYQNGATVGSGATLLVNGALSNAVTVNAGGTLGGNGSVGNVLINGGTLSPGNSIGTLTVQGSLTFTAASSYLVEVSATASDRTNVTGAATLGGATVNASFTGNTFQKQYTILNAAGGVSGSFAGPVNSNLPSNFTSSLSYDASNVYLNLALNFAGSSGLNGNQAAVGNAIANAFNSAGSIGAAFGALTPAGLTQASGELGAGSQQTTFDAMNMFLGVMTDPFMEGRGGMAATGGAAQFAGDAMSYASTGMSRAKDARDAYAGIYRKAPPQQTFEQRWSVWAAGFGGGQSTDGSVIAGTNSTTSRIFGVAVGADYRISPDTIAGFALAGGGTNFTVANALGGGRSDLFQAGAFVRHGFGPAYLSGALAYGWQDITTDRTVTIAGIDRLRAQFNANAVSGRIEGGYRVVTPRQLALTPYAAGQFTTYDLPSYAEQVLSGSGAFALAYGAKTVTATRSELGVRSDRSIALQDGILSLRGRLAWAHDFNTDRGVAATFQTLPGASFVVNGAAPASDAVLTTATAAMNWTSGWSAALTFEGEFSDVTSSYGGKGVVRYTW
ncbi:autotransporter domain-containing protein [Bradyrhizobium mercantei]|uniref:autotransporter domain-containing protein n=1 Tax=Bradyrhizobium mercantei TaxID=1904807 RepID=UPI001AECF425|nr:autotransporter domain-containing protein [Bradyrhizobium mercantei]